MPNANAQNGDPYRCGTVSSNGIIEVKGALYLYNSGTPVIPSAADGEFCFSVADLKLDTTGTIYTYKSDHANSDAGDLQAYFGIDYDDPEGGDPINDGYGYGILTVVQGAGSEAKEFRMVAEITQPNINAQNFDLTYYCYMSSDPNVISFYIYEMS